MDILQSFLLGLIQGLTEFLPISSSGHLALARYILGNDTEMGITFEVVVHFGTLCSIMIFYRNELYSLLEAGVRFIKAPSVRKNDPEIKILGFILISMIPAFVVGFTLKDSIESIFMNPLLVSGMLILTGIILYSTKFYDKIDSDMTTKKAFFIGISQAFAMIPGISRSGSTISTALYFGLNREKAANFSFLMVIPVIGGAMILQMREAIEVGINISDILSLLVGFFTAFISGFYALKYLIIILKKQGFHYFAYYCWVVGGLGMVWFIFFGV